MHFFLKKMFILIQMSLKFVPEGLIENEPILIQVMIWCQIGKSHFVNQQ